MITKYFRLKTFIICGAVGTGISLWVLFTSPLPAADVDDIHRGKVTEIEGVARKLPKQARDWITAEVGSDVISGDKVRTLSQSQAELTLQELDVVRMGPLTTVDIVKLYEETKEGQDETAIKVERGDIWALVAKKKEQTKFQVSTPVTGAAITGTKFRISVAPDSTTVLKVYSGEVKVTNSPDNTKLTAEDLPSIKPHLVAKPKQIKGPIQVSFKEWYYIIHGMQEIHVDASGKVVQSGAFSDNDDDENSEWVMWNKSKDEELGR